MLTEKQKKLLIKFQDQWSILDFSFDFKMSSEEIYNEYSKLIESGEYLKYWVKKTPYGFVKKIQGEVKNV